MRERKVEELIRAQGASASTHIHHPDLDPIAFLEEVRTYPFLAAKKIFIIKGADRIAKSAEEIMIRSLLPLPAFSVVILEADQISKEDTLYQWVREKGNLLALLQDPADEHAVFVTRYLKKEGKTLSGEALDLLLAKSGDNLSVLVESLKKLVLASGNEGMIQPDAVWALAEEGASYDGFDLINAFSKRDISRALAILAHLYDVLEEEPQDIVGILNWHFKRLWQAQEILERGRSPYDVKAELRIPQYFLDDFLRQVRHFTKKRLRPIFEGLFELDCQIKRGMLESRIGLEAFLIRFCS